MASTNLELGKDYWYISADDYKKLEAALSGTTFSMTSFNFLLEVTDHGYWNGFYAEMDEIDDSEMQWLSQFESFDMRSIWESVQAHYVV